MPSRSLQRWRSERITALNEIEAARRSIKGTARGLKYATQQIHQAYTMLLTAQFQGYCRDLHSESADSIVQGISSELLRIATLKALTQGRRLSQGNPIPGNIGSDFNRFGLAFWDEVRSLDSRNQVMQNQLEELSCWRNAIAHQDFDSAGLGAATIQLRMLRDWRRACDRLATAFDEVMRQHARPITGASPW